MDAQLFIGKVHIIEWLRPGVLHTGRELPLNLLTGLRLSVVLRACEGVWGIKRLLPSDRAAFLVILGPIRQVTGGEMAAAMQAFYRSALVDRSGPRGEHDVSACGPVA